MRVTQKLLFDSYIGNMNNSLEKYMDLNTQASSQKRINKPSDDPAGTFRVLNHRQSLDSLAQYKDNIDTAQGWLKQGDDTITQMNTVMTRLKELAEQAATGSLSADNREEVSYEVRELYHQLISLTNAKFENKSIFAGHKVDDQAFTEASWLRDNDGSLAAAGSTFSITGSADKSSLIQFTQGGTLADGMTFRYSLDGGSTFTNGTVDGTSQANKLILDLGGQKVLIDNDPSGTPPKNPPTVTACSATDTNDTTGTWMWVYPTARYLGDDNDAVDVDTMGSAGITGTAAGNFAGNINVRIDGYDSSANQVEYSYSTDNGLTWTSHNTAPAQSSDTSAFLTVPGGSLTLAMPTDVGTDLGTTGQEFVIRPREADIRLAVSGTQSVVINSVGKDVFGGVYTDPVTGETQTCMNGQEDKNLFDTVGRLLSNLETNNQAGVSQALVDLRTSSSYILNHLASIAGRENNLDVAKNAVANLSANETQRMSSVEDADLTELLTKLSQQQLGYQAVLKSSSTIMNLSLMNYM